MQFTQVFICKIASKRLWTNAARSILSVAIRLLALKAVFLVCCSCSLLNEKKKKKIKGQQLQDIGHESPGQNVRPEDRHVQTYPNSHTHTYIEAITHTFPVCVSHKMIFFFFLFCLGRKYGSNDFSYVSQTPHVGGRQQECMCACVNLHAFM